MMKRCVSYCVCLSTFCSVLIIFVKEGFIPEPEPRSSTDNPSIPPGNGVPQPSNERIRRQQIRHFQGEASKSKKREKKMISYYWCRWGSETRNAGYGCETRQGSGALCIKVLQDVQKSARSCIQQCVLWSTLEYE